MSELQGVRFPLQFFTSAEDDMATWGRITDECPDSKGYEAGEVVLITANAVKWFGRGWAEPVDNPPKRDRSETATRGAPENAAQPRYTGHGWWELPGGEKVRAPKDADPEDVRERAGE